MLETGRLGTVIINRMKNKSGVNIILISDILVGYREPPRISTYACRDNRRDFALKIEMHVSLTGKNRARP